MGLVRNSSSRFSGRIRSSVVPSSSITAVALRAAREYKRERGEGAPLVVLSTASPYKFPAAVLGAIGSSAEGGEFAEMDALASLTGVPVPKGLASLRGKSERHRDVIGVGEIIPYIQRKLSEDK